MQALMAAGNLDRVKVIVELVGSRLSVRGEQEAMRRCRDMARSLPRNARIRAGLRAVVRESDAYFSKALGPDEAIDACKKLFDRAVSYSEEASVALYSLGDAYTLARTTAEVVDVFHRWEVLGPERDILQIGCGTGRFEAALTPSVKSATGIDISSGMIAAATRRCAELPRVRLLETSGQDLSLFADRSFDFVYSVDSFPYLVAAGEPVVAKHFAEVARVLRPGGDFIVLNYSYRGDLSRDAEEVAERAREHGFEVVRNGEKPFVLWDGVAFHLRLPGAAEGA